MDEYVIIHPLLLKALESYNKDEDDDILELLKEIYNVTASIEKLYEVLYKLLTSKKTSEFDTKLREILYNLSMLKIEEDDLYTYIENLPLDLIKSIDKISKKLDTITDETERLIYRRILNNLNIILMLSDTSFLMLGEKFFKANRQFEFLTNNGLSYEEAVDFFKRFKFLFEKSISYRYTTIINEEIKREPAKQADLIRIKLRTTFVIGNELEDDLIESRFTTVKNDLRSELSIEGLTPPLKEDYTDISALMAIHLNVERQRTLSYPNIELIMEFKTFLLYISDDNLGVFNNNLLATQFNNPAIKKELLEAIKNIKKDKCIHYSDSKQKEGGSYAK